jgi:hypothetical protein
LTLKKIKEIQSKEHYGVEISNIFAALDDLDVNVFGK